MLSDLRNAAARAPWSALCDGLQARHASRFDDYARDVAAHAALLGKRLA